MAKKVLVKDNKVLSLHSGKVLGAPENYDLDTYLNFYMPFGGTITLRRVGSPTVVELEYSTDGGRTWQIWEEVGNDRTLTLPVEGRMWIRNTSETSTRFSLYNGPHYRFYIDNVVYAYGNTNSLLCKNPDNAVLTDSCFNKLFYNNIHLIKAPDLPSKTIPSRGVYDQMFAYCYWLLYPAKVSAENSYDTAFYGMYMYCSFLKEIETPTKIEDAVGSQSFRSYVESSQRMEKIVCHFKTISGLNAIMRWVIGVASTGDFYCSQELTIPINSISGIPSGWTRHDLSELE